MEFTVYLCIGIFLSCLASSYATVGGQYSVNVHFVPPLVTAPCNIAQFWTHPNVTCAMCFCMTGSLSRCIPQPGCNPQAQNSTSTTENTGTDMPTTNEPEAADPSMAPNVPPPSNSTGESAGTQTTESSSSPDITTEGGANPPAPAEGENGKRKAKPLKPVKSRRRRHAGNR